MYSFTKFAAVGVSVADFLLSIAHCSFAVSICRRLPVQLFALDDSLALRKFGIAIASRIAMIKTTIMISISVKPPRRFLLVKHSIMLRFTSSGFRALKVITECLY